MKKLSKGTSKYTTVYVEENYKFNAPHRFKITNSKTGEVLQEIKFQEGPIKEYGVNGIHNEDLINMVILRLQGFQNSEYKCEENEVAIQCLAEALYHLRRRTNNREKRGVEGTSIV